MTSKGKWLLSALAAVTMGIGAAFYLASLRDPGGRAGNQPSPAGVSPIASISPTATKQVCTNAAAGYSILFPEGWHTLEPKSGDARECKFFDPKPIRASSGTELETAVLVTSDEATFDQTIRATFDPKVARTVIRQETAIRSARAMLFEIEERQAARLEARRYGYIVEHDGFAIVISTSSAVRGYESYKSVVDEAAASLEFL